MVGYQYDAEGNRIGKGSITTMSCDITANGYQPQSDYILDQGGDQVTEMAVDAIGTEVWQHTNVWADGQLIATYDTAGQHFYFNDALGTRRYQADASGALEQTCQSLPFGDFLNCTGSNTAPTEHHFTGKERDVESGLDYFMARYYASAVGRFMSPDWAAKEEPVPYASLDDPQSLNLYSYVKDDPLGQVDPDGHCCLKEYAQGTLQGAKTWATNTAKGTVLLIRAGQGDVGAGVVLVQGFAKTVDDGLYIARNAHEVFSTIPVGWASMTPQAKAAMVTTVGLDVTTAVVGAGIGGEAAAGEAAGSSTEALLEDLAEQAARNVGAGKGPVYGTLVHSKFSDLVEGLGSGKFTTEVSYLNGKVVKYGTPGSVRADVVEGPIDAPTHIYDLKTGKAGLTSKRIAQIQKQLPGPSNAKAPVTEIRGK